MKLMGLEKDNFSTKKTLSGPNRLKILKGIKKNLLTELKEDNEN